MGFLRDLARRYLLRPKLERLLAEARATQMQRTLGARELTALGLGAIVGAGVFAVTGVAAQAAGPAVALSFVVAAIVALLAALAYAELAAMIPLGGSAYTYSFAAGGELFAWLVGWSLILSYGIGNAAVASSFSDNLTGLLSTLFNVRLGDAWTAPPSMGGLFDVPAFLVVFLVTLLLLRPVKESAWANNALVVVKVGILVLFLAVALPRADAVNLAPFAPFGAQGVFAGAALIFFAFIGFDAISTAAEETRDPQRNLPRGIIGSLAIVTVLFVLVAVGLTAVTPFGTLAGSGEPLAIALTAAGLPGLSAVMNVGGILATLSVLLVFQLATVRVVLALARDGLVPRGLAKLSAKTNTPNRLTLALGVLVGVFAAFVPLAPLVALTNIATLFIFAAAMGALLMLRRIAPNVERPFRCPGMPWVPVAGILACAGLSWKLGASTWWGFLAWMALGVMVYAAYGAGHSTLRAHEASSTPAAAARPPDAEEEPA